MNTKICYSTLLVLMILVISLYGCVSSSQIPTLTPDTITARPSDAAMMARTPSPISLPTFTKTWRPTKIPPTAPANLPPTWTPLPTYPAEQARQVVMDLYENNPCKLPCWWGITPGKTSWLEAWQFLGRFAKNRYPRETLLLESKNQPGYIHYRVYLDLPKMPEEKYHLLVNDLRFIINIETFKADYISVDTGNVEAYTLPRIIADYGKPQQIYARGGEGPIASGLSLLLYYPQHGFISTQSIEVEYAVWKQPTFMACFQKVTTALSLWPQERQLDLYERLKITGVDPFTLKEIKPLDQVSDSNVDKFYQSVVNGNPPCIEFKTDALNAP